MNQIFDLNTTRRQQIIVEYLTPTGSGFAVTPQGEQVFLNARLVSTMNVQPGDIYNAFLLPNYPDKREQIPWRAMRVEPAEVDLDLAHVKDDANLKKIINYLQGFDESAHFTAAELADALDMPFGVVEDLCKGNQDIFFEQDSYCLHLGYN
jgi:hypothetical protein